MCSKSWRKMLFPKLTSVNIRRLMRLRKTRIVNFG